MGEGGGECLGEGDDERFRFVSCEGDTHGRNDDGISVVSALVSGLWTWKTSRCLMIRYGNGFAESQGVLKWMVSRSISVTSP